MRKAFLSFWSCLGLIVWSNQASSQNKIESLFDDIDDPDSYASLQKNIKQISIIAPAMYNVDEDGVVWGEADPRVLKMAKQHNKLRGFSVWVIGQEDPEVWKILEKHNSSLRTTE